jgi:hypothetical protein
MVAHFLYSFFSPLEVYKSFLRLIRITQRFLNQIEYLIRDQI